MIDLFSLPAHAGGVSSLLPYKTNVPSSSGACRTRHGATPTQRVRGETAGIPACVKIKRLFVDIRHCT